MGGLSLIWFSCPQSQQRMAPRPLALQEFGQPSWAVYLGGPICNKKGMAGRPEPGYDLDRPALLWPLL